MFYKILVNTEARVDVLEAADWYEQQRIGLGYDFYLNFEDAIELLKSHPYIFQEVYNNFRRTLMKNFPYAIFYSACWRDGFHLLPVSPGSDLL